LIVNIVETTLNKFWY